jgi:hypothetical protein
MEALMICLAFGAACYAAGYGTRALVSHVRRRRAGHYEPYRVQHSLGSARMNVSDHDASPKATSAQYGSR